MDLREIASPPNLDHYEKQVEDFLRLLRADDEAAWTRLQAASHPRGGEQRIMDRVAALSDAQLVVAREHGFESWATFAQQVEQLARSTGTAFAFETAADSIVDGDLATLEALLHGHPGLARERSARVHQATLLHYVAANGVENFRQRCPPNAIEVARLLLDAGADVNATAEMYGDHASILDMLVSSAHPAAAGVQGELAALLLDHGAEPGEALMVALASGYPATAEVIARRTGVDNVVAAAGLGRLDLVSGLVDRQGALRASSKLTAIPGMPQLPLTPKNQLEQALNLAALSNQAAVVELLLDRGVDPGARGTQGFTAAHWAAFHGHMDVLRLLLSRNAPLEARNSYGGTVLGLAVWAAVHRTDSPTVDYPLVVRELLEGGARVEAARFPSGSTAIDELLSSYGARHDQARDPDTH